MSEEKFQIIIIKFDDKHEANVNKIYSKFASIVNAKYGESTIVYNGMDKRVVAAVEKVLKLTE
jgi:hypothetical protein